MASHRPGDKPLSEPMMVSLLTHIFGLNKLNSWIFFSKHNEVIQYMDYLVRNVDTDSLMH